MFYKNFAQMFRKVSRDFGSNLTQIIGNPPSLTSKPVFCMWSDLLGFSNHFIESNWNLTDKQKRRIYDRLLAAHSSVLYYSKPDERNLILNDGIAKIYSISKYEKNKLYNHHSFWTDIKMIFATVLGKKIVYAGEVI